MSQESKAPTYHKAHQINQFGITGQGFQNPISDHLRGDNEKEEQKRQKTPDITDPDFAETLPLSVTDCFNDSIYSNKGNDGSYTKLTTIQKKHIRHPKNPNELYDIPLTDNQKYGWHQPKEDKNVKKTDNTEAVNTENTCNKKKRAWYEADRSGRQNSPMTKFVDDMALTNREFSLF